MERNAPGEAALRSEEETNRNENINKGKICSSRKEKKNLDEIFYKGSIQSEQICSSDAMEVHQGEESAISKGNDTIEKAIQGKN